MNVEYKLLGKNVCERVECLPHKVLTRSAAYPDPSSLGPCQQRAGSNPDLHSLSELSNPAVPTGPQVRQAPVGPVSVATMSTHSLVPGTAYELGRVLYRSREMSLVLIVPVTGTRSELVPLGASSSVAVGFAGVVFAVVVFAVGVGSGGVDGRNRSVMTRGTMFGGFGL